MLQVMGPADVIRELARRWNAGDIEGVLDLYTEDAVMVPGAEWPEQTVYQGREGIRTNIDEWRSVWESAELHIGRIEIFGERVVAEGAWNTRGRSSRVTGSLPAITLCTVRHGKIASLEWFTDYDAALTAARGA
jgi:ketosteroid isomerase-like protein